jgi:hypothetical protein
MIFSYSFFIVLPIFFTWFSQISGQNICKTLASHSNNRKFKNNPNHSFFCFYSVLDNMCNCISKSVRFSMSSRPWWNMGTNRNWCKWLSFFPLFKRERSLFLILVPFFFYTMNPRRQKFNVCCKIHLPFDCKIEFWFFGCSVKTEER